jgi:hypothetical protein
MKDNLLDIIAHTSDLGFDTVKVTGDETSTKIEGILSDKTLIVQSEFINPIHEFDGVFGMPNLPNLKTMLSSGEYKTDDVTIEVKYVDKDGVRTADHIHFENSAGDFKNDYRFMVTDMVTEAVASVKLKTQDWIVGCEPTMLGAQRLKNQANIISDDTDFQAFMEGDSLKFKFGDPSTHSGEFVFATGVSGSLPDNDWFWPIKHFAGIFSLPGDKTFSISVAGVAIVTVNSGIALYTYLLPAGTR